MGAQVIGRSASASPQSVRSVDQDAERALAFGAASRQAWRLIEGAHAAGSSAGPAKPKAINAPMRDAAEGACSSAGEGVMHVRGQHAGRAIRTLLRRITKASAGTGDWAARRVTYRGRHRGGAHRRRGGLKAQSSSGANRAAGFGNRVLGEFADSGENSVNPLCALWNRQTKRCGLRPCRYRRRRSQLRTRSGASSAGTRRHSLAKLVGQVLAVIEAWSRKEDTMQSAEPRRRAKLEDRKSSVMRCEHTIGVGAGTSPTA